MSNFKGRYMIVDLLYFCGFNGRVSGDLRLVDGSMTILPDGLFVVGSIDLECTQITHLPDDLVVGGYLDIKSTPISQLPSNLNVGGSLYLEDLPITELPSDLKVGNNVWLIGCAVPKGTKKPDGVMGKLIWSQL